MTAVVGHERVVTALKGTDAKNVLITGPYSVGKRTILLEKARSLGRTPNVIAHKMTEDTLDTVRSFSQKENSLVFLRLDYVRAKEVERLLKIVEDSSDSVRFYCTSTTPVKFELSSRFTVFKACYLEDAQVQKILEIRGFSSERAKDLSELSYGQVQPTINASEVVSKMNVMLAMKHILSHDQDMLDKMYAKWETKDTDLLMTFCREVLTERSRIFTSEEISSIDKRLALRIMQASARDTTPRFYIRSVLASIMKERS